MVMATPMAIMNIMMNTATIKVRMNSNMAACAVSFLVWRCRCCALLIIQYAAYRCNENATSRGDSDGRWSTPSLLLLRERAVPLRGGVALGYQTGNRHVARGDTSWSNKSWAKPPFGRGESSFGRESELAGEQTSSSGPSLGRQQRAASQTGTQLTRYENT